MASVVTSASQPALRSDSWDDDIKPKVMQRRFTLQMGDDVNNLPPYVGKAEEAMNRKRRFAAVDHEIAPNKLPVPEVKRATKPLVLSPQISSNTGRRPNNEDVHVVTEINCGTIFAVCDGHGLLLKERHKAKQPQPGLVFAQIVADSIKQDLPTIIQANNYDIGKAFNVWAEMVHQKLPAENVPENIAGSTAVIGLYDKVTHKFYTATVGDSEGFIIRPKEGMLFPIPLSPVRSFSNPEYEARVKAICSDEEFAKWKELEGKLRRFPPEKGLNVPNTFGDHNQVHNGQTALTHSPDCTVLQLQEGDLILMGCDGLFDFVDLDKLLEEVIEPNWNNHDVNLAQLIANYALKVGKSTDNVTVIAVRVNPLTTQVDVQQSGSTAQNEDDDGTS